jgi:hypothetical protein
VRGFFMIGVSIFLDITGITQNRLTKVSWWKYRIAETILNLVKRGTDHKGPQNKLVL